MLDSLESAAPGATTNTMNLNKLVEHEFNQQYTKRNMFNESSIDNRNGRPPQTQNLTNLNTQTRTDLAEMERVYQNLAATDSGLNTLIRATSSTTTDNNNRSNLKESEATSTTTTSKTASRNFTTAQSNVNQLSSSSANFGLNIIEEITNG
jgi:hypothetical protein